jgi:hypothetical protein
MKLLSMSTNQINPPALANGKTKLFGVVGDPIVYSLGTFHFDLANRPRFHCRHHTSNLTNSSVNCTTRRPLGGCTCGFPADLSKVNLGAAVADDFDRRTGWGPFHPLVSMVAAVRFVLLTDDRSG